MAEDRSVFWTSFFHQKKSLERLIEESRASQDFYLFIVVSSFITTLGLLIDSPVVVIGGMLVAPLLFPILSLAMGITTSNPDSIFRSATNIAKAVTIVLVVSLLTAFLFTSTESEQEVLGRITPSIQFFLIAFAAGLAAAYSWVKENLSAAFPGVAVSVALIPPLAAIGVGVVHVQGSLIADAITLFLINLLGICLAALMVFSLFGFSNMRQEEKKLIDAEKITNLEHTKAKLEKTKENLEEVTEKVAEAKESTKPPEEALQ